MTEIETPTQPESAPVISYLRNGRHLRASGAVIEIDNNRRMTKVKPVRADWGIVWLTEEEIAKGKDKPATTPRKTPRVPREKKPRQPKPAPKPAWQQHVEAVRMMEIDNAPDGWPAVRMQTLSSMADEIERLAAQLSQFLPIQTTNASSSATGGAQPASLP
jgi:hypothetical protein